MFYEPLMSVDLINYFILMDHFSKMNATLSIIWRLKVQMISHFAEKVVCQKSLDVKKSEKAEFQTSFAPSIDKLLTVYDFNRNLHTDVA